MEEEIATNGGVLSTAGNLVFQGQGNGEFAAFTADTGKKVWSIDTGSAIDSIPVTYSVNGEQYVLAARGMGLRFAAVRSFVDDGNSTVEARTLSNLLAFKLGGNVPFPTPPDVVPPVPKPSAQTADAATIQEGEQL